MLQFHHLFGAILAITIALVGETSLNAKGKAPPKPRPVPRRVPQKVHVKPHPPTHKTNQPVHQLKEPPKPIPRAEHKPHVSVVKPVEHTARRQDQKLPREDKKLPHEDKKLSREDKQLPRDVVRHDELRPRPRAPEVSENRHERTWASRRWKTYGFSSFNKSSGAFHFNWASWKSFAQSSNSSGGGGEDDVNPAPDPNIAVPDNIKVPPIIQVTEAMPLAKAGVALAAVLDDLDVENHWLPGKSVDWKTGKAIDDSESGPASNADAFVASLCNRMKVPMLAASDTGLSPTDQYEWLIEAGKRKHWMKVGEAEAQLLANQGWVVIAAWKNLAEAGERSIAGQTAIVRPHSQPVGELLKYGPRIVMAGLKNHKNISIKDGFPEEAWKKYEIVYLAHQTR